MTQARTHDQPSAASRTLCALLTTFFFVVAAIPALAVAGTPDNPDVIYVPDSPVPTPTYVGHAAGYVWDELENHAHVLENVNDPTHPILLTSLKAGTQLIDLEVTGLPTNLPESTIYTLQGTGTDGSPRAFADAVGRDGKAVFWGIPPQSMTLTLKDQDGHPIRTITFTTDPFCARVKCDSITTAPPQTSGSGEPTNPNPPTYCDNCAPEPMNYVTAEGSTLNQGAVANNASGKISTTGCYTHQMGIAVTVSGGVAVKGTAGSTYTYTKNTCDTIYTTDWGTQSVRNDQFEKATYSDGSSRVYGKTWGRILTVQKWYVYAYCSGGGDGCFDTIITEDCNDFTRTVTESGSGTARVGVGYQVPSFSATGEVSVTAQASSTVIYQITHPDCGSHTWHLGALAGNHATTGLIGVLQHA